VCVCVRERERERERGDKRELNVSFQSMVLFCATSVHMT
jgi:hypothetical protein